MFPLKPPLAPLAPPGVPIGEPKDFATFLIPQTHAVPPWPSRPGVPPLEYPPSDECLGCFESFGNELLTVYALVEPSTIGPGRPNLFDGIRDGRSLAYNTISDLPPHYQMLVRAPYINFLGIRLDNGPIVGPPLIRGITPADVPEFSSPLDTPWQKMRAARIVYKRLLRALFYLKDRFGSAPLFVGTYISSEGVGKFPKHGYWAEDSLTHYPRLKVVEPTTVTFPPQIILGHINELPEASLHSDIRRYQENFSASYGREPTATSPYTFDQIKNSILMPVPPSLTKPFPSSPSEWKRTDWTDEGFESARWLWSEFKSSTQRYPMFHSRATVNLVNPHVRRWWVEKIVEYIEDWQNLAKEAVSDYLHKRPERDLKNTRQDLFYKAYLPEEKTKHTEDWRLGSLFLDNVDGPEYVASSFVPLWNGIAKPNSQSYVRYNTLYRQYKNTWYFMAAMIKELRDQIRHRWGMNVLYNTSTIQGNLEAEDGREVGHLLTYWPFTTQPTVAQPLRIEETLAVLEQPLFQYPLRNKKDLALDAVFDAFVFEQPWHEHLFIGDSKADTNVPRTTVDGEVTPPNPHPREKDGKIEGLYLVDLPLQRFARCSRWIHSILQKKKMVIFHPKNGLILSEKEIEELTIQEKLEYESLKPVRIYDYRFLSCLSWMLRSPKSSLYINVSFFDFDTVYGITKPAAVAFQPFSSFEAFFSLPSFLSPPIFHPFRIQYPPHARLKTGQEEGLSVVRHTGGHPCLLLSNLTVRLPPLRVSSSFSFSLQEIETLRNLYEKNTDHSSVTMRVNMQFARLGEYPFKGKSLPGYPQPFSSSLVWLESSFSGVPFFLEKEMIDQFFPFRSNLRPIFFRTPLRPLFPEKK